MTRRTPLLLLIVLSLLAAGAVKLVSPRPESAAQRAGDLAERAEERIEEAGVEPAAGLARVNASLNMRLGAETRHQLSRALRARARLAQANRSDPIPGTGGSWTPVGKGPLRFDHPGYPAAFGDGFGRVNGRVNDFAYDPERETLYAAVAQGGVWKAKEPFDTWEPVGDRLPIGSIGALAWTPADGGTLIVATGDAAYSNNYGGVGVFATTDEGGSWRKATGVPDGALSFAVAVDPGRPETVYYASGFGLFRSTDGARSFANVDLPTGECKGDSSKSNCFFANMVTDVVVQGADDFGNKGGAVLAGVGWRAGRRPNFNGKPDAPANGVYRSETGAPGTFEHLPDDAGFTPSARAGRIEFGNARGPGQNSDYVYAVSQDSELFNSTITGENTDLPVVGTPSVLDAIYVSADFGATWSVMQNRHEFFTPTNGSALAQLSALGIGPGYQVTYNEFIEPDPTRQVNGVPTRVVLGMEEVWQTATTQGVPLLGRSHFQTIGQYTANGGACLAVPEQCGAKQSLTPDNTTTHPDQHAAIFIVDDDGVTLVVGNDGGVYVQDGGVTGEFTQLGWGIGANEGFHTLLPYGAVMAKDGTVWAGLQDNGQMKITPEGEQIATYVGDGTYALVDPDNSDIAYDELPNAGVNVTTDGGVTWTDIAPTLTEADFVAPMVMDPHDARHVVVGGREIVEKTDGPDSASWTEVFDLGTSSKPGDTGASATQEDPNNHATAAQVLGDDIAVGYCGSCDPVKLRQRFNNGIATNVGGSAPGKRLTGAGWHIAAARGLPNRFVTSIAMDPADHRTFYVTLGASALRYFAPIGSQGEDASDAAGGHVYKSTDAGETFTDITGDLPKVQATGVIVRPGQLVVSTAIGAFASRDKDGRGWAPLGDDLPPTAIYSMSLKPDDPDLLVAATFGRGVYKYRFADRPGGGGARCTGPARPVVRARVSVRARRIRVRGSARATRCPALSRVRSVEVAVQRKAGRRYRSLRRDGRLGPARRLYLRARGRSSWRFTTRRLPRGRYRVHVRARDAGGRHSRSVRVRVRVR